MRPSFKNRRLHAFLALGCVALGVAFVVGVAGASIPQDGVFTGCYLKSGGALRVVDPSQKCKTTEQRVTWNQQGQPGEQGAPGPGAIVKTENWCGGEGCPGALTFSNEDVGTQKTFLKLP